MPELPDLTIFAKNLRGALLGRRIDAVRVLKPLRVSVPESAFSARVVGAAFSDISREGKEMLFQLSNGASFSVHLMLSGRFSFCPAEKSAAVNQAILSLCVDQGPAFVVSDMKEMAKVTLDPKISAVPDALSDDFSFDYFLRVLRKSAMKNIKALLIDQQIVRGIGNAYVDEILYDADIAPGSVAGKIPASAQRALYDSIQTVLQGAIETLERLTPNAISGEERGFLRVHNFSISRTEKDEPIIVREIAGKKTCYTAKQKLYM